MSHTKLAVHAIAVLSDNYTWLLHEPQSNLYALVDPPVVEPVAAALDAAIAASGGRLAAILLTHHHPDHVDGADALRARYGARLVGAAADAHRLPRLDEAVAEGSRVSIGAASAEVFETPGHTVGHVAYYVAEGPALFCGDTLFSLGVGRFFEGTAAQMFASLAKFAPLPGETLICCGHEYTQSNARFALTVEPENAALRARAAEIDALRAQGLPTLPSRLDAERATNPFLRARSAEILGEIRAAKDRF